MPSNLSRDPDYCKEKVSTRLSSVKKNIEGRNRKIRTSNSDNEIQNDQHQAFHIVRPPILDEKVNEQDGDEEHDGLHKNCQPMLSPTPGKENVIMVHIPRSWRRRG